MAKKVYLAGPMSGYKDYNFPAFAEGAKKLRDEGHVVFSPAEADLDEYGTVEAIEADVEKKSHDTVWRERLTVDFMWILANATAIALLPGWSASKGACAELALANALGLEVIHLD